MSQTANKIIIIGAGLGGLVLAQVLSKHNIPCEIYERDDGPGSRQQGWSLNFSWIIPHLTRELPHLTPPIGSVAVNAALGGAVVFGIFDAENGQPIIKERHEHSLRVNRANFRNWLTQNIHINWGKRYKSHEVLKDGQGVRVLFEDGSIVDGAALVGADGVNSRVRGILFGEAAPEPETVPLFFVVGVRKMPKSEYQKFVDLVSGGCHFICAGDHLRIFSAMREVSPDLETAEYIWYVSWVTDNPSILATLSRDEKFDLAKKKVENFVEPFRGLIWDTPQDADMTGVTVRTITLPDIKEGPVTLLGDAAHAMTPFKGEGAQHAMMDSLLLGKAIVESYTNNNNNNSTSLLCSAFKKYEGEMLKRGREATSVSKQAVGYMHKSLENWRKMGKEHAQQAAQQAQAAAAAAAADAGKKSE